MHKDYLIRFKSLFDRLMTINKEMAFIFQYKIIVFFIKV